MLYNIICIALAYLLAVTIRLDRKQKTLHTVRAQTNALQKVEGEHRNCETKPGSFLALQSAKRLALQQSATSIPLELVLEIRQVHG